MKKTTITRTKKLAAILFALVLSFCCMAIPSVNAETLQIETINAGQVWRESWPATQEEAYVYLNVTQTGFYKFTVNDYKKTANHDIYIRDAEDGSYVENLYNVDNGSAGTYVYDMIYLVAGRVYQLECAYIDFENDITCNADISVKFEGQYPSILNMPLGAVNTSTLYVNLQEERDEWFAFKPDSTGEYAFCYSNDIGCYVNVIVAATAEEVYDVDTEYYSNELKDYAVRSNVKLWLEKNVQYYIKLDVYRSSSSKLSIQKVDNPVKNITVNNPLQDIDSYWDRFELGYDRNYNFRVEFTDNTSRIATADEIRYNGYEAPNLFYAGETVDVNGLELLVAGKNPLLSKYNDEYSVSYINVKSITEELAETLGVIEPYETARIFYDNGTDEHYRWRIRTDYTGFYSIHSWLGFDAAFSEYSIEIIDEQNNLIEFNQDERAWPLVANREYALYFKYKYAPDEFRDVEFWLEGEEEPVFPDAQEGAWYYDSLAYTAGRGIIKGFADGTFGISDGIQRQDFLVILARLDGAPLSIYQNRNSIFPDVAKNSYYDAAIHWGYENGIVSGYDNGEFGVGDYITREQLVTFLRRYADHKLADIDYSQATVQIINRTYKDASRISSFSKDAVYWAVEKGVIKGKTSTTLDPQGTAQRCEIAAIMYNIFKNDVL